MRYGKHASQRQASLTRFPLKGKKQKGGNLCALMDLVRVASQPSGLTPSTRAGPSLRAVDAQRPCVARLVFRPESLVQIAPLHEL